MKKLNNYIQEKLVIGNNLEHGITDKEIEKVWNELSIQLFINGISYDYKNKIKPVFCKWINDNIVTDINQLEFYIYSTSQKTLDFQKKFHEDRIYIKPKLNLNIDKIDKIIKESDKIYGDILYKLDKEEEYYFCNSQYVGLCWKNIDPEGLLISKSYKVAKLKHPKYEEN